MNEDQKLVEEIVGKAADKAASIVSEKLTAELVEKVKAELPLRKDIFNGSDEEAKEKTIKEAQEKAATYLKHLYNGDFAQAKAMTVGTAADGGYLAPDYFASEIIRLQPQYGVVRRNARIVTVTGKNMKFPTAGAVTAYRVGETVAITSSKATIGQVTLSLKKVACLIPTSNELLADANVAVVDLLTQLAAEALAKYEDEWGIAGKGAGEGIFQNTNVPTVTLGSGETDYVDIHPDDLLDALSKLDESALAGAKWYMSFSVFNALRKQKASTSGDYFLQNPAQGMPATIWNVPVEFVATMPKTSVVSQAGTAFIALGNLNYMMFGDGRQYSVDISREATVTDTDGSTEIKLFEQDMSAVRVIERVDIQIAEPTKAFVYIVTAAS